MDLFAHYLEMVADTLCGYPVFFLLIGGGLFLFLRSGMVSIRHLPESLKVLRGKNNADGNSSEGQISSAKALASAVAATIGLGNIAGVAIALVMGGPGAIFWMWVSAIIGMATKYHEGVLSQMYRGRDKQGQPLGGTMYIIEHGLGPKWRPLAIFFATAGMFGTLCIINANQLAEVFLSVFTTPEGISNSTTLSSIASLTGLDNASSLRAIFGITVAALVALVVLRGIKRISDVASILVPFMVILYFLMVLYIILTNLHAVPGVVASIFREAFNLRAGIGALAGIAIIGARRAAMVNDAGIGTASIMHGASRNSQPVREGLVAMLGPSLDSGLVCTLTAFAILLVGDVNASPDGTVEGLSIAIKAFAGAIPFGEYLLLAVALCFGLSSMFSYSFYGTSCASYLVGPKRARWYTYAYIITLAIFAVVPLGVAVNICDLFYALMAFPTMFTLIMLSGRVRRATKEYFAAKKQGDKTAQKTE